MKEDVFQLASSVFEIARAACYRRVVVRKNTWGNSYAVVERLEMYGEEEDWKAYATVHYSDGSKRSRLLLRNASAGVWRCTSVLAGSMEVVGDGVSVGYDAG